MVGGSAVLFAVAVASFGGLGAEFVPRLDEGDIAVQTIRLPSVSLTESLEITDDVEDRLMQFDEVETVVGNTGRAEISTDPMGVEITDAYVILKPKDEWPEVDGDRRTKAELVEAMQEAVEDVPAGVQFYQPIEMRTNELIAGARGDVVVKVFGESYDELTPLAEQVQAIVQETPGATSVSMDQTTGSPQLVVRPDRAALARYGLTVAALNRIVQTAVGGAVAGEVYEGERRFDLVVRFAEEARRSPADVEALPVVTPTGARVPLGQLAEVEVDVRAGLGLARGGQPVRRRPVERDRARPGLLRRRRPGADPGRGRAAPGLPRRLRRPVREPRGRDRPARARRPARAGPHLRPAVPDVRVGPPRGDDLPLRPALRRGRGGDALPPRAPVLDLGRASGFIALFGIAVLNGLVMVGAIRKFELHGLPRREAVLAGADERLRAVVTTATLAAIGFTPMLLGSGAGAEVQRPLAAVVIGGLVTSTVLTLFVLPTVYAWVGSGQAPAKLPGAPDVDADLDRQLDAEIASDWAPNAPAVRRADAEAHGPDGHGDGHDVAPSEPRRRPGAGPALGLALALLLGAGAARAQEVGPPGGPATPLTLAGALDQAEAVAPELALGTAAIAREAARRESAGILPATEFFLGIDRVPTIDGGFGGTETAVGVGQSFRLPAYYRAQRGAADALLRQAEVERGALRRGVRLRAALAYVEAVAADARLALADSSASIARGFATASNRRQELGATGPLEPLQAEVALAQADRVRAEAAGQARSARAALATYLARRDTLALADALPEVGDDLPDLDALAATGALDALLVAANPRVAAAEAAVRVAEAEARAVATEKLPSFGAEAALQTEGGAVGFLAGRVGVAVPLARIASDAPDRAAQAAVEVARRERDRLLVGLAADLRTRVGRYRADLAQLRLYQDRLVPQAERAYAIAVRLRREGAATYLEVLQAQTALVETRAAALEVRLDAVRLRTEIDALLDPDF